MAGHFNRVFAASVLYLILGVSSDFSLGADDFYFTKIGSGGESNRKTVIDGERRVIFECAVSDSRQIGFKWTLNGIPIENTTRRYQIGSNLYFSRIEREYDIGEYGCVATNYSSKVSRTSPPISLNVICSAMSNPVPANPAPSKPFGGDSPVSAEQGQALAGEALVKRADPEPCTQGGKCPKIPGAMGK